MRKKLAFICIVCMFVLPLLPASHAADKPFFEGKHVRLVVANSPGGGYDTYARLIARHFSKHIPGNPNVIVQNMPGGGGVVCANWLFNIAPKDGTVIAHLPWRIWGFQLARDPKVKFDIKKMNAVGVAAMAQQLRGVEQREYREHGDGQAEQPGADMQRQDEHILGPVPGDGKAGQSHHHGEPGEGRGAGHHVADL